MFIFFSKQQQEKQKKKQKYFRILFFRGENYNVVLAPTNYATGRNLSFINGCAAAVKMYISARYLVVCIVYVEKRIKCLPVHQGAQQTPS